MNCAPSHTFPSGPGFNNPAYQGCAIGGAQLGSLLVDGSSYLSTTFDYSRSNLWRNFGVVIAWTVLYLLVTAIAAEIFNFTAGAGGALEFKRSRAAKKVVKAPAAADVEHAGAAEDNTPRSGASSNTLETDGEKEAIQEISGSESVFTWSDVEYTEIGRASCRERVF